MIASLLLGVFVSSSYVAVIKLMVPYNVDGRDRNDPIVIRFRLRRILCLCLVLLITVPALSRFLGEYSSFFSVIRQMGLLPGLTSSGHFSNDLLNIASSFAKITALYMGPIFAYAYTEAHNWRRDLVYNFASIYGIRDHVFAPITEEFVYRAVLVAILKPVLQERSMILYSPLLFGIAHVHHGYTLYYSMRKSLLSAVISSTFQFVYTTLFGIMANNFYVKSEYNLWCPIVVHAMCNLMSFPSFDVKDTHPRFFYIYCGMFIMGIVMFCVIV